MTKDFERLKSLLEEMFQLDQADLDFGIYRIINYKRKTISKFLNEDLLPQVRAGLEKYALVKQGSLIKEMEDLKRTLDATGVVYEQSAKYLALKKQIDEGLNIEQTESEVYSHLANFFSRYYDNGDFISTRRYKKGVYAIPYEGEEVKFYYANADQYYIKTAEFFKDYSFKLPSGKVVHFKLVEADTEKDNNKTKKGKERKFVIYKDEPLMIKEDELYIQFEYKFNSKKQDRLIDEAVDLISSHLKGDYASFIDIFIPSPTEKNPRRTLIEKHLKDFTAKNTFDYFIHKDLEGFLKRELDFYLKNEVMFLDDLNTTKETKVEEYITKIKVIKSIGHKIIDFLAQIEEFQKKLWLKKKFIVQSDYCITLDRIDERFYTEIIKNEKQIKEWIKLFAIDELDGYTKPLTVDFLKENPYLILDTVFYSENFKDKLLESIEEIDDNTNGILIHSENFQALNLLQERYKEKVKCCYIDPPYNTNASKIIYKNGYEHSSWIALMSDRLQSARELLSEDGIIEIAIDDYELTYLNMLMNNIFGKNNFISNIAILTNPKGRDQEHIAQAHDYSLIYAKDKRYCQTYYFSLSEDELNQKYSLNDGEMVYRELPLKRTGSERFREDRPYMFFPFLYKDGELEMLPFKEYKQLYDSKMRVFNDQYLMELKNKYEKKGYAFILPIDERGNYLRWRWGYDSCANGIKDNIIFAKKTKKGNYNVYEKNRGDQFYTPKSLWFGEKYDASSKGTNLLKNILPHNEFDYPKSLYTVMDNLIIGADNNAIILDFFAGSGTTGHAVINLNREDGGRRKYILIEMGEHFNTVLKPRMQRVIYSKNWANGKPMDREGCSQILKYMKLESYDDTLNNLAFKRDDIRDNILEQYARIREQYMLSYMLDKETKGSLSLLNVDSFKNPFEYKLKITKGLETKEIAVNLIETFNYLIGLTVTKITAKAYFNFEKIICSDNPVNQERAVIFPVEYGQGEYSFKEVEGVLQTGEKVLIIWRNMTDDPVKDNTALDAYFEKKRSKMGVRNFKYSRIYVNGDNNLLNMKLENERWQVVLIEEEFYKKMFDNKKNIL